MRKKIPKEKLFGKELAKQITPKALNTYREDLQNFKNFYNVEPAKSAAVTPMPDVDDWTAIEKSMTPTERREFYKDKPQKEKPKDLYKDLPKFDYDSLHKELNEISKNFFSDANQEEPVRPDLERKEDPDFQSGLGSLLRVKD
tara:strand:- start:146 stop:574 length:429 start_codon:yes stop_codon:yes gene_type:complete